ncbi:hypothetical protein DLM_1769 [Aquitalea magnusonii]|uniref:Uncharacterized protein n=1 Tax=Aquitalea magnusonii TaxID=332411 RepID=A0A3G9GD54_9NEIS|nr:hypothetical protein DLM_1769 [Aquitalea magnusonii]
MTCSAPLGNAVQQKPDGDEEDNKPDCFHAQIVSFMVCKGRLLPF